MKLRGPLSPKTLRSEKVYHQDRTQNNTCLPVADVTSAPDLSVAVPEFNQQSEEYQRELELPMEKDEVEPQEYQNLTHVVPCESQSQDASQLILVVDIQESEQSVPSLDSQISLASIVSRRIISSPVRRGEVPMILPGILSVPTSESRCFICQSKEGRSRIPNSARIDLFIRARIHIPEKNRVCKLHLLQGYFTEEAKTFIKATKPDTEVNGQQVSKWLNELADRLIQPRRPIDFNLPSQLTEGDFKLLTGIGEAAFNHLLEVLRESKMRESGNRTLRNALGIFLVTLRLNLSQRVLAFLFGIPNQSVISETIDAVSQVLSDKFVAKHLGYQHLNREELMTKMCSTYHTILERDLEDLILILDGTYLYVEKSSDFYLQRRSYSSHKHRNLFKPMVVTAPNGYVIEADGLYFSDGLNNDAKILNHMLNQAHSITSILQTRDCLVLDRGFRDVIDIIEEMGIQTFMPHCLKKGQTQFTMQEANESRKITKLRWVVESVNGRLKGVFTFFYDVIPAAYFKKLNRFLRIALAIQNAFFPPLLTETEVHIRMAEAMKNHDEEANEVQEKVQRLELDARSPVWMEATENDCLEFPTLTMEELEMIALGPYQMKMGKLYREEHLDGSSQFKFYVHKDLTGLIRVRLQSRFSKRQSHLLWVEFTEWSNGRDAIRGYYCRCKAGARTLGCCSHVAAVSELYLCIYTLQ